MLGRHTAASLLALWETVEGDAKVIAETQAFLLTAPGVDPKSVETTGVGVHYKTTEGLGYYLRIPLDRLPESK